MNIFSKQKATILLTMFICFNVYAQQPGEKEIKKSFAPKGTYKAPFKKANEACLTSVNIQFKLATRQEQEKRGVGNVITWGFLEGIEDNLMQEITDEYYKLLAEKLKANGISLSDEYKNTDQYQKLINNSADLSRETEKKNWGVSKIFTANNAPYIEFPIMAGPHSSLGNKLKKPVGMVFITVDFININQNIKKGISDLWGERTDKFETNIEPIIRIEGVTQGAKMKGDGTYAKFAGPNYSFCNPSIANYAITSGLPYTAVLNKAEGMPESMKKFKSAVLGDVAAIFSKGLVKSGRGVAENTFVIQANPEAYKTAVLNALNQYNDYLLAYIKANN